MSKRPSRSDKYQYLLLESSCSHEMMESYTNRDSIYHMLDPFHYDEELKDLEEELKIEFWKIVNNLLTPRQREVIRLYSDGYTQMEIAKRLNVNQSSITKSLNGNVDYKTGKGKRKDKSKKAYGGALKKISKIVESNEDIKKILDRMNEIRSEKW